jgi:hypothetical protein
VIHRLKSIIVINCYYYFSDASLPLSRLIIFNSHGLFKLEKREMIFQGGGYGSNVKSLVLKEKISDKILEVFVLFLLIFLM